MGQRPWFLYQSILGGSDSSRMNLLRDMDMSVKAGVILKDLITYSRYGQGVHKKQLLLINEKLQALPYRIIISARYTACI